MRAQPTHLIAEQPGLERLGQAMWLTSSSFVRKLSVQPGQDLAALHCLSCSLRVCSLSKTWPHPLQAHAWHCLLEESALACPRRSASEPKRFPQPGHKTTYSQAPSWVVQSSSDASGVPQPTHARAWHGGFRCANGTRKCAAKESRATKPWLQPGQLNVVFRRDAPMLAPSCAAPRLLF